MNGQARSNERLAFAVGCFLPSFVRTRLRRFSCLNLVFAVLTSIVPLTLLASELPIGSVKRADIVQKVMVNGTFTPKRSAYIRAPFDGYVHRLFVKIGDQIKVEQPIVTIGQTAQATKEQAFPMRSSLKGRVVQIKTAEGESVSRQSSPNDFLVRIDDTSEMFVTAQATETDVVNLTLGQACTIRAAALTKHFFEGVIDTIALAANNQESWDRGKVEFTVTIKLTKSPGEAIKPGMTAIADIITNKAENVLTLSQEFVYRDDDHFYVILANGEKRDISVGLYNAQDFEIKDGLQLNDKVRQVDFIELAKSKRKSY